MPFPLPLPVPGSPDLLLLLLAALTFDALMGDLDGAGPVARVPPPDRHRGGKLVRPAAQPPEPERRSSRRPGIYRHRRVRRGGIAAGLALTWALGLVPDGHLPYGRLPYGRLIEVLIVAGALSVRRPWNLLRATGRALEWKGITAGREAVRPLTGRHVYSLMSTASSASRSKGPLRRWSGGWWHRRSGTRCWGFRGFCSGRRRTAWPAPSGDGGPRHDRFGLSAAWLHALMSYVPARLTALLVVLACPFVPNAGRWMRSTPCSTPRRRQPPPSPARSTCRWEVLGGRGR